MTVLYDKEIDGEVTVKGLTTMSFKFTIAKGGDSGGCIYTNGSGSTYVVGIIGGRKSASENYIVFTPINYVIDNGFSY